MDLLFNLSDFLGPVWDNAFILMTAYWKWLALLIGISVGGIILRGIFDKISDELDWLDEKADLSYDKISFQQLFGNETGASMFEAFRLKSDLPYGAQKFVFPKDMKSGQSEYDYLSGKNERFSYSKYYTDLYTPDSEEIDPTEQHLPEIQTKPKTIKVYKPYGQKIVEKMIAEDKLRGSDNKNI